MFKITLTFCSGSAFELLRVDCSMGNEAPRTCVRGKTGGAYGSVGTFQWSSAVRATACLFLKTKLLDESDRVEPVLSGGAKSLAASLDYALTKQPGWILDMFGVSAAGKTYARRLFRVTNSHRKRGGPVAISPNPHLCHHDCVEVVLDGKVIEAPELLRTMLNSIEAGGCAAPSSREEEDIQSCKNKPSIALAA
jgi:hypothetical protein